MASIFFDDGQSDDQRRARLYAGDLIVLSPCRATMALIEHARHMLEAAFAPHDPLTLHHKMKPERVAEILATLKPQFIHHPTCKRLIAEMLQSWGADIERTYFDLPRLRTAYPSHFLSSGIAYAFHPHRDTWYSAPMCQINWWMPLYPLDPDNAMAFYPRYFAEPVANSSQAYNYYDWNSKGRLEAARHVQKDTREQPKALEALQPVTVKLLPPPGGTIAFSGAHLHETVPNTTDLARYSIDFRTVHLDDVRARRGAPNVDASCTGTTMRDFLRASDLAVLPDSVIKLYDDVSSTKCDILQFGERAVARVGETVGGAAPT